MEILIVEPYDTGSHHQWMVGYQAASQHNVQILSLPGQFWKWRMQGGAVTLARQFLASGLHPDVILASDMLNLPVFLALTRQRTASLPVAVYFHENQLTYPLGPRQRKEIHFQLALINYQSALAADACFFNSAFHRESFFAELPRILKHYPDFNELQTIDGLRQRSAVLPLGLDLQRFDAFHCKREPDAPSLILWNHRWEYDKNPRAFLNALYRLNEDGFAFRVALTGESFRQQPEEFEAARVVLGERIVQYGYVERFEDYARLLWQADVQVSTAYHDFFGVSTCEAIYCGCVPLLPNRLNYPALIPARYHDEYLYHEGYVYQALRRWLEKPQPAPPELRAHVAQFDWQYMAPRYDEALAALVRNN
ncbi:MAG: DUF3524 domain-containing protein [Anaerolineae bacterium]